VSKDQPRRLGMKFSENGIALVISEREIISSSLVVSAIEAKVLVTRESKNGLIHLKYGGLLNSQGEVRGKYK